MLPKFALLSNGGKGFDFRCLDFIVTRPTADTLDVNHNTFREEAERQLIIIQERLNTLVEKIPLLRSGPSMNPMNGEIDVLGYQF